MKHLKNTMIVFLLSAGFAYAQNITVQGDKKLNTDFKKYKTFACLKADKPGSQIVAYSYEEYVEPVQAVTASSSDKMTKKEKRKERKNRDVIVYSYFYTIPSADSIMNKTLTNSVKEELEGRGYRHDDMNPDLLVAYKIFDQTTKIKGYNAEATTLNDNSQTHQPQDTVTYKLKPGSVLISLIDAKTGSVVWEGYASGVAKEDDVINDKMKLKEAVNLIFKKFEFRADKYSTN